MKDIKEIDVQLDKVMKGTSVLFATLRRLCSYSTDPTKVLTDTVSITKLAKFMQMSTDTIEAMLKVIAGQGLIKYQLHDDNALVKLNRNYINPESVFQANSEDTMNQTKHELNSANIKL